MMESSNLDHHQHQQDLLATSSLPPLPNFHAVSSHHECNQSLIFNNGDEYHNFIPSCNTIMVQDLGFHHRTNSTGPSYMNLQYSQNQETMPQIKEEFLDSSNNTPSFFGENFSLVLPRNSINSHLNQIPSSLSFSMAMDLRSLDILASSKLARSFYNPSMNHMMFFNEDALHELGHHHHHHQQQQQQEQEQEQETHVLSNGHHHHHHHYQMKTSAHGVSEERRSAINNISESAATTKKHRLDSRSSTFSHFKVRKEKLGDRIAALQQLVSPFGKTDTASVLMEAIGYIKFLQDQVETLSVPYMRSSGHKKLRTFQREERDELKADLRSRGLCLVPLSCTSYVTDENGGLWSSPNFRG